MLLLLLMLTISVAAVAATAIYCLLDVAFQPSECAGGTAQHLRATPPSDANTFEWFSDLAARLARSFIAVRRIDGRNRPGTPVAGLPDLPPDAACDDEHVVSRYCSSRTTATPAEVLAIADHLRRTKPAELVDSVRQMATANATLQLQSEQLHDATAAAVRCPLACDDGTCLAMPVRPLQCLVHCTLFGQAIDGGAQSAAEGAEDGLHRAISEVGLEHELYELNSALSMALSATDTAERWSRGEDLFATCTHYSGSHGTFALPAATGEQGRQPQAGRILETGASV